MRSLQASFGLYIAFAAFGLLVYRGAMTGPFLSDDSLLIVTNPYLPLPVAELVPAVFAPTGEARHYAGGNYAPLLHLAHAFEGRLFRGDTRGYHLVNVLVHALNGVLLFALLLRAGLARAVCFAASALFLLHPANVEAVAWISQLKSVLALAFSFAALIAFRRHPRASSPLFALALLTKATAVFALPMAATLALVWRRSGSAASRHVQGLALWTLVVALYALPQLAADDIVRRANA
jgi:Gpi18-like mannosyltransferase